MHAAARHSNLLAGSASFLQQAQAVLPALALHATSLTSLSRSCSDDSRGSGGIGGGGVALATSSSNSSRAGLALHAQHLAQPSLALQLQQQQQQQQRRPLFNFAGLGGDLSKSYEEKKLLG